MRHPGQVLRAQKGPPAPKRLRARRGPRTKAFLPWAGLAAALALSSAPAAAAPVAPRWTERSAGLVVHGISTLRIPAKGPEVWYARAYGSRSIRMGLVRSLDKGKTWEPLRQGLDDMVSERDGFEITLDPKDDRVFYVVTRGKIYRTSNAGQSFENIGSGTQTFSMDRSQSKPWVAGVAVDPSNSKRLLAGTLTVGYHGGVFESKDGGKSWTQIAGTGDAKNLQESGLGHDAWPITLDRSSDKYLIVGGLSGSSWVSEDRGAHFTLTQPGGAGIHRAYQMSPMVNREVFLAESRGLWKSRDAGASWGKTPLLPGTCISVDLDQGNRKQVYAILRGEGLWRTSNLTKWEGPKHGELDPHEVYVHPSAKNTVFLASLTTGLWMSTDKGETFKPVAGNLPDAVPSITHAAVHAADPTHMMAVSDTGCVFVSQDRGATWSRPGLVGGPVNRLVGASSSPRTWLAAGAGVRRTEDLGKTWDAVHFSQDPEDRVVDLEQLPDGRWLAVWERAACVWVGKDAGEAWADAACGRPNKEPGTWASDVAVDPKDPDHWLLATRTTAEAWSRDDKDGGPYETKDGGKTWTLLDAGLKNEKGVHREGWNRGAVAAIDASGAMLYGVDGVGLFRWQPAPADGGAPAWTQVALSAAPGQPMFNAFAVGTPEGTSPAEMVMQVEGLTTRATLHSMDGGATWTPLPDPAVRLHSLSADPTAPGRYLAGDVQTDRGVLVLERPGATPPPAPPPVAPRVPPPVPSVAKEQPPTGLLAFSAGADGNVNVWSLREGKALPAAVKHGKAALALALSKDETRLYTGGADKIVGIWNGATAEGVGRFEGHANAVGAVAVSPDGARLYTGDEDYFVYAWDVAAGKAVAKWEGHTGGVTALVVSPDGRRVYSAGRDRTVRVWDAEKGKELFVIPGHPGEVLCLALSADGSRLYTGARDASVRAFEAEAGKPAGTWTTACSAVTGLALSPNGALLYVAGDAKEVAALSTADGKKAASYAGGERAQVCVAVSADGHWLVAGGEDGLVRLWRTGTPAVSWTSPKQHEGWIHGVVLTPDVDGAAPPAPAAGNGGMAEPTPPAMDGGAMSEPEPPAMDGAGMAEPGPSGMDGAGMAEPPAMAAP